MVAVLLDSKLHAPNGRRRLVPRPRLGERLDGGLMATLTLVSAPAGFGKTTILSQWLSLWIGDVSCVAWLSLDGRDNLAETFWTYVITSLRTSVPGLGTAALALLQSHPCPFEEVLIALLNDIGALPHDVVLVLDDYHVIEEPAIQEQMTFVLDHRPAQLRVVISGRTDPPLPVARLRARGELVEIRAADLRFSSGEASAYLNEAMNLALKPEDVSALEARTEGWIAALQLAALSLQGRDDVSGFIRTFAGDDRYVVDYLVQEVLEHQPEPVRQFLLQTSILDRLSGPLCDAVTGREDSTGMLTQLERANLFLVPLDDRRLWYRYHQLFADVLQVHLREQYPNDAATLHGLASRWFEVNESPAEAITHALAARDFGRAAELVEGAIPDLRTSRQEVVLLGWLRSLPDDVLAASPVLSVALAGTLLAVGEYDGVETRLRDAEKWIAAHPPNEGRTRLDAPAIGVLDSEEFGRLAASVQMHRAGLCLVRRDPAGTVRHAREALELAAVDDHLNRGAASALMGLAAWGGGDLEVAHRAYTDAVVLLRTAGFISDSLGCRIALADIGLAQGRVGASLNIYEQGLAEASPSEGAILRGAADMHVGLGEMHRERGDLAGATHHLERSHELGEHLGLPQNRYRWRVAMARIRQTEGDLEGALELLNEAERFYVGDFSPDVRPVPAMRARLQVAHRDWGQVLGWVKDRGLSVHDDLSYLREFEHITLARVLMGRYTAQADQSSLAEATTFLGRLQTAAESGHRNGSVIEVTMLQALAHQAGGDIPAALVALEHALVLAEPEGYVRTFVDEGPPMNSLLRAAAKQGISSQYAERLLAGFTTTKHRTPHQEGLIDPLSERELVVLRLLGTDLDGPGIARELSVSLTTVRTHIQHIYTKLGVNSRRAAVRRAQELALVTSPHNP